MDEDKARRHGTPSELGGGADLISALPTDLLLQVLVLLHCACTAARTSILSRRWRGLWTRLPELTFRDVAPGPLLAALSSLGPTGVPLSLLDIHIPEPQHKVPANRGPTCAGGRARRQSYRLQPLLHPTNEVSMLLRATGKLSPAAFRSNHPHQLENPYDVDVDLSSCFHRTTSIELDARFICFPNPQSEFPTLESLSISGCLVPLAVVVPLCPRLRVLRVPRAYLQGDVVTVRSPSLQELVVENEVVDASTRRVDVEAPALNQLSVFFRNGGDLSVSVLAPTVEKVSWRCSYLGVIVGLGLWGPSGVTLQTKESNGQGVLPPVHVLCLHMIAMHQRNYRDAELAFAAEIEKHMVANFSGLEVHLITPGHVFGAFLLRLLGMHPFRTAARSLKVVLQRFERKDGCPPHCPCDEPKNWRTQTISLANLEKLDIIQFKGVDHEFDFLKLVFRCAPMLNKVTVELSKGFTPNDDWWTKIHNIFMAYPSVEGNVRTPGN